MNKKALTAITLTGILALSACTNETEQSSSLEFVNSVKVTVEDFIPENSQTRTSYTVDNTGFHFQWADGDALGIYPIGGDQVKFPISSGDGSKSAVFDGGSWKLRSEYQYAAYYPFSTANYTISQTALPVSYTGQAQNGNNTTSHLGKYDYLACAATLPDGSGGVDMTMKHLGAFVRLQLTMPKADTYSSVVLESDGAKFVTAGTFDLTAATPAITATTTSSIYTINLSNIATTEKNQTITVYTVVAPANLSTSNVKVTVHGKGSTTYVQTVTGKNFEARKAYNIAVESFPSGTNASGEDVSWEETAHEYVDLGLSVKWATMNVGATEVAGTKKNSHTGQLDCYGEYYAWGETTPKDTYAYSTYSLYNNSSITKYVESSTFGTIDNKTTLELADDAAHANWGGTWRMPSFVEQQELFNGCYWEFTTNYNNFGVAGYVVYKVKDASDKGKYPHFEYDSTSKKYVNITPTPTASYSLSDTHIFLPASGLRNSDGFTEVGVSGSYWSSSLREMQSDMANKIHLIGVTGIQSVNYSSENRIDGLCVRAVCP